MRLHPVKMLRKLPVFLGFQLIVFLAQAQEFNSSISAATGGTGRAAVEAVDALFMNPSSLVHLRGNHLTASASEKDFAISLTDNNPDSTIPAALGFMQRKTDLPQGELVQQDIAFALSEFVTDKWAFGITGHYREQTYLQNKYIQPNGDLGVIYTPTPDIGWAVVAYNVFGENKNAPEEIRRKASVAGGFNYIYKAMTRFRVDLTSESQYMVGLENYLNKFLIIRAGYMTDTDDDRRLGTAGAAFKGPRFALNYAYQGNSENSGDYRHSVDLEIPF